MLFVRQEVAAAVLAGLREHGIRHRRVLQALETINAPPELHIGYGLDVEHQHAHTAALSAAALPASIAACISRTATSIPSNTARAMIAWPMLSSTISGIAATACTLV